MDKVNLIEKYLRKKKEKKLVNLVVKDYDQSNFYFAVVYNEKINLYKVLYIPMDLIEGDKVDDYVCYQFIKNQMVDYIIKEIRHSSYLFVDKEFREKNNPNMSNYYIEINLYDGKKEYKFMATKHIPKEWLFMYEIIVLMFEHCSNIVNELCVELLAKLNNTQVIEYQLSYNFDLYNDKLESIFSEQDIKEGESFYNNKQVKFLEKVNEKYFAVVKDHVVIIEYNERKKILNLYCECSCTSHKSHIYAVILNILNNKFRNFYKVKFDDFDGRTSYYLCYGTDGDNIKVIHDSKERLLGIDLFKKGFMKIIEDPTKYLEKTVLTKIEKMYSKEVANEVSKYIRVDLIK